MTTIDDLVVAELAAIDPPHPRRAPANVDTETGEVVAEVAAAAPNLPAEWWTRRPELVRIRQAAHARTCSADAVLAVVLARVAALAPPSIRLPAVVGTAGTLDVAVALIGRSGTGKSTGARVAGELVPIDDEGVNVVALGTGEGIVEAYIGEVTEIEDGKTRKVRRQVHRSVFVTLDEGQALIDLGSRNGSTLMPTIRSAWSGDRLGQANASEERRRNLAPGEYRFALVTGFQTEHAAALLDDAAGGTPQRFLYAPAEDPTIPDDAPPWPGPFAWTPPRHQSGPMDIDAVVATEIRGRNLARSRGETTIDLLDAHRDLSRLKVAGLLALLADRLNITPDDWTMAGEVLDASDRVRSSIVTAAQWRAQEAERAHTAKLARRSVEVDRKGDERAHEVMARAIARHVHKDECGGCKRRCAGRSTPSKYRGLVTVDDAIDDASQRGWITVDGDTIRPGEARPA